MIIMIAIITILASTLESDFAQSVVWPPDNAPHPHIDHHYHHHHDHLGPLHDHLGLPHDHLGHPHDHHPDHLIAVLISTQASDLTALYHLARR